MRDMLRLKAVLDVEGHHLEVHVVGGRMSVHEVRGLRAGSRAEAILLPDDADGEALLVRLSAAFDALQS
jgi:hypothetical protein